MTDLSAVCTSDQRKRFLIGVPFFLLVTLALPLLLLLIPVVLVACLALRVNPWDAIGGLWGLLTAIKGTQFEVAQRDHSVLVHIS